MLAITSLYRTTLERTAAQRARCFPLVTFNQGTGSCRVAHSARRPYVPLTTTASFETFLGNPAKPRSKHFRFHQKIFDALFSSLLSFPAINTGGSLNGEKIKNPTKNFHFNYVIARPISGSQTAITSTREGFSIHPHPALLQAGPFLTIRRNEVAGTQVV
ncbi:hypothetical protein [Burkholderia contaminans]|uniref:hypothetical protein n=1 Tax=Burkholderia contaminans TaxID=488447 RepID=UPI001626A52B|nr:hypothetical protein [Burkholderia contaminans]